MRTWLNSLFIKAIANIQLNQTSSHSLNLRLRLPCRGLEVRSKLRLEQSLSLSLKMGTSCITFSTRILYSALSQIALSKKTILLTILLTISVSSPMKTCLKISWETQNWTLKSSFDLFIYFILYYFVILYYFYI